MQNLRALRRVTVGFLGNAWQPHMALNVVDGLHLGKISK